MVDQDSNPWASWGQQLPRFFLPGIVIANEAESGETSASFKGELRMAKVMSVIKPGDWFFMQFNHNDQKPGAVSLDQYKALLTEFVTEVRAKGATTPSSSPLSTASPSTTPATSPTRWATTRRPRARWAPPPTPR
jgi:lysophospholipase L1-like esterase